MSARAAELHGARTRRRELRPVQSRKRGKRNLILRTTSTRTLTWSIALAIVVSAIVFAVLFEHALLAQSAFELQGLRERTAEQEAYHEELLLEAAQLDSAARIERYARETLGMVEPPATSVRYIVADIGRRTIRRNDGRGALAQDLSPGDEPGVAAPAQPTQGEAP